MIIYGAPGDHLWINPGNKGVLPVNYQVIIYGPPQSTILAYQTAGLASIVLFPQLRQHAVVLQSRRITHRFLAGGNVLEEAPHDFA